MKTAYGNMKGDIQRSKYGGLSLTMIFLVVLSLFESRLVFLFHLNSLPSVAQRIYNITTGHPDWVEFQARLLGPWIVRGFSFITGIPFQLSFLLVLLILHLLKNTLCGVVLFSLTGRWGTTALYSTLFAVLFILFMDIEFIYPWDYLDNMVFLLFLYGVIRDKGDGFFGAVFLAGLLNRESALFIPLWLVLDAAWPIGRSGMGDDLPRSEGKRRALWGIILLFSGVLTIHLLRRQLLVRELGPDLFPWFADERPYHLLTNLQGILQAVKEPLPELNLLMHSLLFLIPIFFFLVRRRIDQKLAKLGVMASIMVASILVFGLINEPRTFNILIPFAVMLPLYHFHLKA